MVGYSPYTDRDYPSIASPSRRSPDANRFSSTGSFAHALDRGDTFLNSLFANLNLGFRKAAARENLVEKGGKFCYSKFFGYGGLFLKIEFFSAEQY